jgi:hypothetical protein
MIALLLLLSTLVGDAQAEPRRFTAGGTLGVAPFMADDQGVDIKRGQEPARAWRLTMRAGADYGLTRRLSVVGEVGNMPGSRGIIAGAGPQLELVDSRWWRLGLVLLPEVEIPFQQPPTPQDNLDLRTWVPERPRLVAHTGTRASWLAFWGVSITGRADYIQPLLPQRGRFELGTGLSFRM